MLVKLICWKKDKYYKQEASKGVRLGKKAKKARHVFIFYYRTL